MHVDEAIRSRRTLKAFTREPVPDDIVRELLELAVLAPNHHLTRPWRFVVLGPETLARLVEETGDVKLTRSATAVAVGIAPAEDPLQAEEDYASAACAIQNAMLGARARGLASYWRTPGVMRTPRFAVLLGAPGDTRWVGLLHLGEPAEPFPEAPVRVAADHTSWLP
jgi:nitroreductase